MERVIRIEGATENNLKGVNLTFPHYHLIVVTGVSGSGKSSLINEVLNREGQRLFYENFTEGRFHAGKKIAPPEAEGISGLFPAISVNQFSVVRNPRSTVGTLTEIHDFLRLLFSRFGEGPTPLTRAHFSWNHPSGQCPECKGLGVEDRIDPDLIVGDAHRSLREGALLLTTPNHYIIYSQVTMDVLDQVCRAEGFTVDIPWKDLTEEQKKVIWYGSEKIKILFGKHPLESRLKWSGITAKPREEGYYKGILPVMEEILKRDRNPNILRFARSFTCPSCLGRRLNRAALSSRFRDRSIDELLSMSIEDVGEFVEEILQRQELPQAEKTIVEAILNKTRILNQLGLGYLSLYRESMTLSGGESGRIRLGNQVTTGLRNVLYILDEPSAGLHPSEQQNLLNVIRSLVDNGNTVIAVEHDEITMRAADWIIDIGPGPGEAGGEIIFNGPAAEFFAQLPRNSITASCLSEARIVSHSSPKTGETFKGVDAALNNLQHITVPFLQHAFNVITGVSGSGKSSLARFLMETAIPSQTGNGEVFRKVVHVDQAPIGRTPNSNPATYTGLSDHIRDLFASLPESKARNYKKGQFSFVVKGGRCEACSGAGKQQVGMHFLGNVSVVCEECGGKRFTDETLAIQHLGKNIYDVLELTVHEAHVFFTGEKKIRAYTSGLMDLGLGYLKLGQPSNTLSGGEAQRIKLATELVRPATGHTLYILDEPTTGLHMQDVKVLLKALQKLIIKGHTLLCIEHDPYFILQADRVVELGPGSGKAGGRLIFSGSVTELLDHAGSKTAEALKHFAGHTKNASLPRPTGVVVDQEIVLLGVTTNKLKHIDVAFPANSISIVTGVSGSGKSSLVQDTLFAESQRRFMEGMSSYIRQFIGKAGDPQLESSSGLMPSISVEKKKASGNPRSIVGTYTGIYDLYRLLYSRLAKNDAGERFPLSSGFSFNHESGACPHCKGLGHIITCDPDKLISHPDLSLVDGALSGSKTGRFYGDPHGQYVAVLCTVGASMGFDFQLPWIKLNKDAQDAAMFGCGDRIFDVEWKYKRGNHEGVHKMHTNWPGFAGHVNEEYTRKHADHRGEAMLPLMSEHPCSVCHGTRLRPEMLEYKLAGNHIAELCRMDNEEALHWFQYIFPKHTDSKLEEQTAERITREVIQKLQSLITAGLGYIAADRLVSSLSGGEFQRIRLAGLTRSSLTGICVILDEPSFGLHKKDTERIARIIERVHKSGNTVIMIDHSVTMADIADHAIQLGPGSGEEGGELIYSGPAREIQKKLWLYHPPTIERNETLTRQLHISGAYAHNLQHIDIDIPLDQLVVISGVSGSGKTSLAENVIAASFQAQKPLLCKEIRGFEQVDGVVYIEQEIPTASPLSVPVTYLGILDPIRKAFAGTAEAKAAGLSASHFSFNGREGQCPDCQGKGTNAISMDFWSDAKVVCESCRGKRYNDAVLSIRYGDVNVAELLEGSFKKLSLWCQKHLNSNEWKKASGLFRTMEQTGLSYLCAGQALDTLSVGELQRLKLTAGISTSKGRTLFILDEPSGGLHPEDTIRLLRLFGSMLSEGHSLLCISHDRLIIDAAHKHIELGPGGGKQGGRVISVS